VNNHQLFLADKNNQKILGEEGLVGWRNKNKGSVTGALKIGSVMVTIESFKTWSDFHF
jgi:hypothetical protein